MLSANGVQVGPLEIRDFSGGITDNFIAALTQYYQRADNFYINDDRKLVTRPGLILGDEANPRIPTDKRINALMEAEGSFFLASAKNVYSYSPAYTQLTGPSGNIVFSAGNDNSYVSWTAWNKHLFVGNSSYSNVTKIFHDGTQWKVHQVGLPIPDVSTLTITGAVGVKNYLFAIQPYYRYTSEGVLFEEVGPVSVYKDISNINEPDAGANKVTLTNLPSLVNNATTNYDTANVKYRVYRTTDSGAVFFLDGEFSNGATIYESTKADTPLQLQEVLYSSGDVPDHEAPPPAKYIHSVNDILVLGNVKEGSEIHTNRVRFSNRFQPFSCPGEFYEDFDEEVMGVSSVGVNPIIFCKSSTFRLNGFYLPNGTGSIQKNRISDTIGCVSARSIVQTNDGVFWAGNDGFYFSDGNRVIRVSELINSTYKKLTSTQNQRERIYGTYDPVGNRVLWAAQSSDVAADNDTIFALHLQFGIKPDMAFTTWSGGATYANNFAPTSIYYHDGAVHQGDTRGYLLKYSDIAFTDLKIDTVKPASEWLETTIIYDYRSPALDFGSSAARKWVPWLVVNADNASSISLAIFTNNDNSGEYRELAPIKYKGNIEWGDYDIVWGDQSLRWNYFPIIGAKRRFPAGGLRCSYKQVRFSNAYVEIETSKALGTSTFNATTKEVVLDTPDTAFPMDVLDYYVSLETDLYERQYRILSRTPTTLVLEDINGDLVGGTFNWKIQGYRRREILKIISYVIDYSFTSQSQDSFRKE
ncbi:hypothetical protein D3C87_124960 [compost metagenome]